MKIAIIGASGKAGKHMVHEAKMRGYEPTAIVKNKATLKREIPTIEADLFHLTAEDLAPFDVIINAFAPLNGEEHLHVEAGKHLISLLTNTNKRLFVIGSSGILFIDCHKTIRLLEHEDYPEHLFNNAKAQLQNLQDLQNSSIQWTFISPPALFDVEGPRTGHYTVRKERVAYNSQLDSYSSYADLAVAVIDEIENKQFINESFTLASENFTSAS
ncbi:MAG: NAD(P)H-binding protein [Solibacillus sp.]